MSTAVVSVCPMGQRSPSLLARWARFTRANESASRHGTVGIPSWAMGQNQVTRQLTLSERGRWSHLGTCCERPCWAAGRLPAPQSPVT